MGCVCLGSQYQKSKVKGRMCLDTSCHCRTEALMCLQCLHSTISSLPRASSSRIISCMHEAQLSPNKYRRGENCYGRDLFFFLVNINHCSVDSEAIQVKYKRQALLQGSAQMSAVAKPFFPSSRDNIAHAPDRYTVES